MRSILSSLEVHRARTGSRRLGARKLAVALAIAALAAAVPPAVSASGVCTGTSADAYIDYGYWDSGDQELEVEGYWRTFGASSARLQFYIDDQLYQTSYLGGGAGSWHPWLFQDDFDECGSHTFRVKVCPRVFEGGGYTVCETHCDEASAGFSTYGCLDVDFDCDSTGPTGVVSLTADIQSGNPPYKVEKFFPNSWYVSSASTSSTFHGDGGRCSLTTYRAGIRITDSDDQVESKICPCAPLF